MQPTMAKPRNRRRLPLVGVFAVTMSLALGFTIAASAEPATAAKWKQPACGKFKKKIRKAQKLVRKARTGAQKSKARNQLKRVKSGQKLCQNNRRAYAVIKNGSYESDDSDIVVRTAVETFCASGRWNDSYQWRNTGWKVTNSRFRSKTDFAAVVEGLIARKRMLDGTPYLQIHRIALTRKGNEWTRGTVSFTDLGTIYNEKPAIRKPACG